MTRKSHAAVKVDADTNTLVFDFGKPGMSTVTLAEIPEAVLFRAALHGLNSKLRSAYSETGSAAEAKKAFDAMVERLAAGEWNVKREGGVKASLLAEGLHRATGRPLPDCITALAALGKEQLSAVRANPQVAKAIADIKAERAAAALDAVNPESETPAFDVGSLFGSEPESETDPAAA